MDLLTVQEIEGGLTLSPGTLNEAKRGLITSVSAKMAIHCGREDWGPAAARTEIHDGGSSFINLRMWPVDTSETLVVYDDVLHEWGDDTVVDSDLYYVNGTDGVISSEGWIFGTGTGYGRSFNGSSYNYRAIKVTFTGGYAAADIPADLKRAALLQFEREYDLRYRSGSRQDDRQGSTALLPEVIDILRKYTRRDMIA